MRKLIDGDNGEETLMHKKACFDRGHLICKSLRNWRGRKMARGQGTYREWENWNDRTQREREHKSTNGGKYNPNNMGCFINST